MQRFSIPRGIIKVIPLQCLTHRPKKPKFLPPDLWLRVNRLEISEKHSALMYKPGITGFSSFSRSLEEESISAETGNHQQKGADCFILVLVLHSVCSVCKISNTSRNHREYTFLVSLNNINKRSIWRRVKDREEVITREVTDTIWPYVTKAWVDSKRGSESMMRF